MPKRQVWKICDLAPSASVALVKLGFKMDDPASIAVPLVYGDRLQGQGDTQVLADWLGVNDDVVYQWVHRAGGIGVSVAIKARQRAERQRKGREKRIRNAKLATVIKAWNAGVSGTVAASAVRKIVRPSDGAHFISDLRKQLGEKVIPYRRPTHWNRRTASA